MRILRDELPNIESPSQASTLRTLQMVLSEGSSTSLPSAGSEHADLEFRLVTKEHSSCIAE